MTATRKQVLQAAVDSGRLEIIHIENDEVKAANTLAGLASERITGYSESDHDRKEKYHKRARRQLGRLATLLGLKTDDYDLRLNRAGPAVCGETTLHTDTLYIQVSQSSLGRGHEIMYRRCKGRKDYSGGQNHFGPASRLDDVENFRDILHAARLI